MNIFKTANRNESKGSSAAAWVHKTYDLDATDDDRGISDMDKSCYQLAGSAAPPTRYILHASVAWHYLEQILRTPPESG